ncbi:MAG: sulfatase-like hydrolase/transferase [bacterium]
MQVFRRLGPWLIFGVFTSILFLLLSPYLFHFLLPITVFHTLYCVALFGSIGLVLWVYPELNLPYQGTIPGIVIGAYLVVWLYQYSVLSEYAFPQSLLGSLIVGFIAVSIGFVVHELSASGGIFGLKIGPYTLLAILVGGVFLKLGLVQFYYTPEYLIKNTDPVRDLSRTEADWTRNLLYPFSLSVSEGLERFELLLPELNGDDTIVFLVLDALRNDYVGIDMYNVPVTPNLDSLAKNGKRLERYYVQSNWTKSSTASLFTGEYVRNHGVLTGGRVQQDEYKGHVLPSDFKTLAERLKRQNYSNYGITRTSHISARYNFDQGFDLWLSPSNGYVGEVHAINQALYWLLRQQPERAFLYLHLKGPHHPFRWAYKNLKFLKRSPYTAGELVFAPGNLRFTSPGTARKIKEGKIKLGNGQVNFLRHLYAAQLNLYDRKLVGPFLNNLKTLGLNDDGFVLVGGDHGEELYDHKSYAHSVNLYEEVINPGMILKFPVSTSPPGGVSKEVIESIDLTATLLDYAGSSKKGIPGRSFYKKLPGDKFETAFSENPDGDFIQETAVIHNDWKLIYNYRRNDSELYNLEKDPAEQTPVSDFRKNSSLKDLLFSVIGSDSIPNRTSIPLRDIAPDEKKNLQGLGYIE